MVATKEFFSVITTRETEVRNGFLFNWERIDVIDEHNAEMARENGNGNCIVFEGTQQECCDWCDEHEHEFKSHEECMEEIEKFDPWSR